MQVSERALDAFIEQEWPLGRNRPRPPWERDVWRSMYVDRHKALAAETAKRLATGEIARLRAENAALTARVAKLEKFVDPDNGVLTKALIMVVSELRSEIPKYRGYWEHGEMYAKASMVTHSGSLWIAVKPTQDRPGDSDAWGLCAKRGRDGRHAKDSTAA